MRRQFVILVIGILIGAAVAASAASAAGTSSGRGAEPHTTTTTTNAVAEQRAAIHASIKQLEASGRGDRKHRDAVRSMVLAARGQNKARWQQVRALRDATETANHANNAAIKTTLDQLSAQARAARGKVQALQGELSTLHTNNSSARP
jgi:hypothetical protein